MPRKSLITATRAADGEWLDKKDLQPSRTETENEETATEAPDAQDGGGRDGILSHTEPENTGILAEVTGIQDIGIKNAAFSHTETESDEILLNASGLQEELTENSAVSQTDTEIAEKQPGVSNYSPFMPGQPADSHTGTESEASPDAGPANPAPAMSESEPPEITFGYSSGTIGYPDGRDDAVYHTGTAQTENGPGAADNASLQSDQSPVPHTEPEPGDDQAVPLHENGDAAGKTSGSHTDSGSAPQMPKNARGRTPRARSGEKPAEPDTASGSARRRRARPEPVLAIDSERSVETQADKLKNDLLDLVESQKGRRILTGTIQGVERPPENPDLSFAVIYHGAFKVIIPPEEAVQPPEDFRGRSPADVMHYLITKRLGAEIDFIVKGVDVNAGIAAASRLEAMAAKRRQYYSGTDRDGNNLIYEGLAAEARVVSVIRAGIFIDLFGLETYISLRELSYQRWIDAAAHFQPGQRVLVKILRLDRSDRDNIRVSASVKQAGDNPYEQALKRYTPGSRYVGTVSLVDTNGVFVSLDGGIDCLCSYPKRGRPPRGARVTVRIIGVNHESNRIWGAITHMTTVR